MSYHSGLGVELQRPGEVLLPGQRESLTAQRTDSQASPVTSTRGPVITGVSPIEGMPGDEIIIRGRNLEIASALFGGFLAPDVSKTATELRVLVPPQVRGNVHLIVRNRYGRGTPQAFRVTPPPPPPPDVPEEGPVVDEGEEVVLFEGEEPLPSSVIPTEAPRRSVPWLWIGAGVAVVGLGGWLVLRRRP